MKKFKIKRTHYVYLTAFGVAAFHHAAFADTNPINPSLSAEKTPVITPKTPQACLGLETNSDRLACYDAIFRPVPDSPINQIDTQKSALLAERNATTVASSEPKSTGIVAKVENTLFNNQFISAAPKFDPSVSLLDQRWELSEKAKLGTWQIRAYQPVYLLPVLWTSKKNDMPFSPNPQNAVTTDNIGPLDISSVESKFQISFKTKALENIFNNNGDLWIGYTQSSHWQVYNASASRPFRESNYEPEASLIFRTNYQLLGLNGRLLGLTLNHQSNGRSDPLSRSWNRVIMNLGFEKDNFTLMLRPWYRLEEERKDDNNPDIKNYIGRGDLTANYKWKDHNFSLMLRHSLKGGDDNHGAMQFDWAFPLNKNLRGHLQVFDGYGESLIDYNHRATYIGAGISLVNWF